MEKFTICMENFVQSENCLLHSHFVRCMEKICKCSLHVVVLFWASVSCRLAWEETRFRMRITLGVVLIRPLVIS